MSPSSPLASLEEPLPRSQPILCTAAHFKKHTRHDADQHKCGLHHNLVGSTQHPQVESPVHTPHSALRPSEKELPVLCTSQALLRPLHVHRHNAHCSTPTHDPVLPHQQMTPSTCMGPPSTPCHSMSTQDNQHCTSMHDCPTSMHARHLMLHVHAHAHGSTSHVASTSPHAHYNCHHTMSCCQEHPTLHPYLRPSMSLRGPLLFCVHRPPPTPATEDPPFHRQHSMPCTLHTTLIPTTLWPHRDTHCSMST